LATGAGGTVNGAALVARAGGAIPSRVSLMQIRVGPGRIGPGFDDSD